MWVRFGGVESRAYNQERILETSSMQNGGFIKAQGQDPRAERAAAWACEGWLIVYLEVWEGKGKERFQKAFHVLKKTPRIPEALPLSVLGFFFPLGRHYHEDSWEVPGGVSPVPPRSMGGGVVGCQLWPVLSLPSPPSSTTGLHWTLPDPTQKTATSQESPSSRQHPG